MFIQIMRLWFTGKKIHLAEVYKRVTKFASALEKIGISSGDTVSIMAAKYT